MTPTTEQLVTVAKWCGWKVRQIGDYRDLEYPTGEGDWHCLGHWFLCGYGRDAMEQAIIAKGLDVNEYLCERPYRYGVNLIDRKTMETVARGGADATPAVALVLAICQLAVKEQPCPPTHAKAKSSG